MAKATGDEIRTRYEIALVIVQIQSAPNRYGARGIDTLALALGCDRATLFRYGQVARAFDPRSMRRVLAAQKRQRGSLSWSHLVLLSSVADHDRRRRLLEDAMTGISVRELERRIAPAPAPFDETAFTRAVRRYLSTIQTFKGRAMIDVDLSKAPRADIEKLVKSQEELREICDQNLRALRNLQHRPARLTAFNA
jgi:hypothetical protein